MRAFLASHPLRSKVQGRHPWRPARREDGPPDRLPLSASPLARTPAGRAEARVQFSSKLGSCLAKNSRVRHPGEPARRDEHTLSVFVYFRLAPAKFSPMSSGHWRR